MDGAERPEKRALLHRLLVNLVKAGFVEDAPAASHWCEDGSRAQRELQGHAGSLSAQDVHLDALWNTAIDEAQRDGVVAAQESVKPRLQTTCLFDLDELTRPDFDFGEAAERIRLATATG